MRRKFAKNFLGGDARMVGQTFDTNKEAAKFCRLAHRVVPSCRCHVRRIPDGVRCSITANNVAEAWLLTLIALHTWCMKKRVEIPDFLHKHTHECQEAIKKGKRTWYLIDPNTDGRMTCKEYTDMVSLVILIEATRKESKFKK